MEQVLRQHGGTATAAASAAEGPRARGASGAAARAAALVGSFGLSCVILFFLFVLTFAGTLEQQYQGLHAVQRKYFDSWFLWAGIGGTSIPFFPGGQLLLWALAVNLVAGGIVRLRKSWSRAGILIVHVGIAVMLVSGFVKYYFAADGHLTLWEGERSQWFQSYYDWEVAVTERLDDGRIREHVIPQRDLAGLESARGASFTSAELPFRLTLSRWTRNGLPRPHAPVRGTGHRVVDGFYLEPRPRNKEAERDLAGCYLDVGELPSGANHEAILWGGSQAPFVFAAGGKRWSVGLRHRRWKLPFTIVLEDFRRDLHPGTSEAMAYESDVIKIEDGVEQHVNISMNRPLRHAGYILFQSSWGPSDARPGQRLFSTFAVARNPSDQWPLISCIIIAIGLVFHFSRKLARYVRSESRSPA